MERRILETHVLLVGISAILVVQAMARWPLARRYAAEVYFQSSLRFLAGRIFTRAAYIKPPPWRSEERKTK